MDERGDDYYSSIAPGYDELHGAEQDEKLREFLARVELREGITLVDVGCGTGRSMAMLDDLSIQWHGIEPSAGLIEHAAPAARIRIKQARGEELPFPDASFDVILSLTALQNFDDPQKGLREMLRVAKPGAIFLISFLKKSPKRDELDRLVREGFQSVDAWEQSKDLMYICSQPI